MCALRNDFFFPFGVFAWKMNEARWNHASFTLFLHLRRYPISSRADGQSSDYSAHYAHLQRVDRSWCNFLRCVRNESPYVKRNNAREDTGRTRIRDASGVLCADRWFRIIIVVKITVRHMPCAEGKQERRIGKYASASRYIKPLPYAITATAAMRSSLSPHLNRFYGPFYEKVLPRWKIHTRRVYTLLITVLMTKNEDITELLFSNHK